MIKAKLETIPRALLIARDAETQYTADDLAILAADIRAEGLREPLLVRPLPAASGVEGFEVIVGKRRLRACEAAELDEIPCMVATIDDDALAKAEAEYRTKRERWIVLFPHVRAAMLAKSAKLTKLSPPLLQTLAVELGLPKKIKAAELGPALAASRIRDELNAAANSYFAEERIAPWAKGLGIDIKAIEKREKAKRR